MHVAAALALGVRATPRVPAPRAAATLPPPSAARIAALVAVPIAWGTYSPAVEFAYALPHTPPPQALSFAFVAVSAASLQLASALAPPEQPLEPTDDAEPPDDALRLRAGAELGLWLFLGSNIQLLGLQLTDAARAGFIVQLTTVLVPLAEALLLRRALPPRLWAAVAAATAGIAQISVLGGAASGDPRGDALVAASAVMYTAHVVRLGEFAAALPALGLAKAKAAAQLALNVVTLGALQAGGGVDLGGWAASLTPAEAATLGGVCLWNGLVPSAFTTWAQSYGQSAVSPTAANVLYSLQPVTNAAIAAVVLGEVLTPDEVGGGALVLLGAALASTASEREGAAAEEG